MVRPLKFQFKAFEGSFHMKVGQGVVLCDVIDGPKCMYSWVHYRFSIVIHARNSCPSALLNYYNLFLDHTQYQFQKAYQPGIQIPDQTLFREPCEWWSGVKAYKVVFLCQILNVSIFFSPSVSLHLFIFTEAACINVTRLGHYILPSMIAMMANDVSTKSQRFAQRKGVGGS